MANHQPIKDPFAKIALIGGLALILLTVGILVKFLINTIQSNSIDGEIDTTALIANKSAMTAANLKPIGEVTSSDGSGAAPSAARSGEEVYTAVCAACHNTGAAGAPKIDDKAAWEPRAANGFDALMNSAINGKNAMPARGGQNVPDGELKAAIAYMTGKVGVTLDIPKDEAAAPAAEKKAEEAPKAEATTAPAGDAAPQAEAPATEAPATEAPATEAPATEAPATEAPATEDKATPAPATEAAPSTPASPSTPEAPSAVEAPQAPTAPETASPEATATNTAAAVTAVVAAATAAEASAKPAAKESSIDGEAIYKKTCFACHDMGIAGAPKLGDKALWEPRIATGADALYSSAIDGKTSSAGVMPPKGGNMTLTDEEVKATVDYMISQSQ